jgi:GxxExxY protein
MTQHLVNELTRTIIGCAIEVHKELGPGLLESVYEKCMYHLLTSNGYRVSKQRKVPLLFKGLQIETDLRLDLLVDDLIIVELKPSMVSFLSMKLNCLPI